MIHARNATLKFYYYSEMQQKRGSSNAISLLL
nr:MAG TPA: hypothetical protein [Caudoviricetes sp.]